MLVSLASESGLNKHTHPNTVIELIHDTQDLIARCIVLDRKRGIMRADFRDVAVLPAAELRVVIAGHRVCRSRSAASC
jgi:hypothetical protein